MIPTPLIPYRTGQTGCYGVMITASHNPFVYNSIKVFLPDSREAGDEFFNGISAAFDKIKDFKTTSFDALVEKGIVTFSEDVDDYVDAIVSTLNVDAIKASKQKILFNPMHGSSTAIMEKLFEKMGANATIINGKPDPLFGGKMPAPYVHNLVDMAKMVVEGKYDCGIALDGDGDRITVIDSQGKFYDCNYLAASLYYYMTYIKKLKGGAVKSFLSSNLITRLCKKNDVEAIETLVGFKYLGAALKEHSALIAVESSGMAFSQISFSKDAVAAATFIIDLIASTKKGLGELVSEIVELVDFPSSYLEFAYPFSLADREATLKKLLAKEKPKFDDIEGINEHSDGFKIAFKNDYWCAARISGTENVMRIYTEMKDAESCKKIISIMEEFYGMKERQI